ncbi:MAG: hypothetical protein DI539_00810 [Flavobacterium psychrophilum]|nr:MAG: hypothetical protein DI539_00810 [Flavobacterium psychrophilum]
MTIQEFIDEAKSILESNPDSNYRFFIGDVFDEREPILHIKVNSYADAIEMLSKVKPVDSPNEETKFRGAVDVYLVIYEKKQSHQ